ncbi:hypothetical protein ACWCQS_26050, partial [Streptomyces sp. NPDC002076]
MPASFRCCSISGGNGAPAGPSRPTCAIQCEAGPATSRPRRASAGYGSPVTRHGIRQGGARRQQAFTPVVPITLEADSLGNQLD